MQCYPLLQGIERHHTQLLAVTGALLRQRLSVYQALSFRAAGPAQYLQLGQLIVAGRIAADPQAQVRTPLELRQFQTAVLYQQVRQGVAGSRQFRFAGHMTQRMAVLLQVFAKPSEGQALPGQKNVQTPHDGLPDGR